jgi:chromosome segregation ATPase
MRELIEIGEDEKSSLRDRVKQEQKELKQLKEILQELKNEMGSFQNVCSEKNDLISKLKKKEKELLNENDQLTHDLKNELNENKKVNDQMAQQADYIEELQKLNNMLKNKNLAIMLKKFLLSVEINRLSTQNEDYKARMKILEIQLENTKQELDNLENKIEPEMLKINKELKKQSEKKPEMNPDMLKKIDKLNECMQQLEERIISKLRDISPIMSRNNSLDHATSIRETSPFLPKKISKKMAFPLINEFECDHQKHRMVRHCRNDQRECQGYKCNSRCPGMSKWINGCSQVMLTLGSSDCATCQINENNCTGFKTPHSGNCQKCNFFCYI